MATAGLWLLALALAAAVWRRDGWRSFARTLTGAGGKALALLPRIVCAVATAGFAARLLPMEAIARHIGPESGASGAVLAMAIGAIIPGGPIISFPLVVVLRDAGAGLPQLVTLLTAWSVFAVHRVLTFEIPLMGLGFTRRRFVCSLPLPLIAGGLAAAALALLH